MVVAGASRRGVVVRVVEGEELGTYLPPASGRRSARKAWIAFVRDVRGRVEVDRGAERALLADGRSLLAAGVRSVQGSFVAGDAVEVAGPGGRAFARGIVNYSSAELPSLAGKKSSDLAALSGGPYDREVIHRDELVVVEPWEHSSS